jgi:hypothetical protein
MVVLVLLMAILGDVLLVMCTDVVLPALVENEASIQPH